MFQIIVLVCITKAFNYLLIINQSVGKFPKKPEACNTLHSKPGFLPVELVTLLHIRLRANSDLVFTVGKVSTSSEDSRL